MTTGALRSAEPGTAAGPPRSLLARLRRRDRLILGWTGTVAIVLAWQLTATFELVHPTFTSSPAAVLEAAVSYLGSERGLRDLATSGQEFGLAFLLAIAVGIPVGILMGWYRRVEAVFDPVINFFYASPRIALTPLVIIWFGIGLMSKIVVIFLMAVFPIVINTASGVAGADRQLVMLGRSFSVSRLQMMRTIVLPGAVPSIIAGLRLGLGQGLIGVYVAELTAATAGVGFAMNQAGLNFQTDLVFATLFIIAGFGVLCSSALKHLERRVSKWRPELNR
jgi:ABC-type nitrate/sulfonate/bicarbonate transport system permease component